MKISYWRSRWEKNRLGWHRDSVNPDLERFYDRLELSEEDTLLVPLCGKSLDLVWLARRGPRVIGVEVSETAAEQFIRENELETTMEECNGYTVYRSGNLSFWVGDFFDLQPGMVPGVTAVYDRAALVALPGAMRGPYVEKVRALAAPSVRILLSTFEYSAGVIEPPPFSVDRLELESLYGRGYSIRMLSSESLGHNEVQKGSFFRKHVYLVARDG